MVLRNALEKLGEAVQSFWDILEAAYYGRFNLHDDGASPSSQLLKVGVALTIAMSASILTSAIALPLVMPVILCWCMFAPCTGRAARSTQNFLETCAAGILIPFVCLFCTSVALFKVTRLLSHSTPKSVYRLYGGLDRKVRNVFDRSAKSDHGTVLPIYHMNNTVLTSHNTTLANNVTAPNSNIVRAISDATEPASDVKVPFDDKSITVPATDATSKRMTSPLRIVAFRHRRSRAFQFLDLPPELRIRIYQKTFEPYRELRCSPTRLLRANRDFRHAMSLLRTCHQIREEATTYLLRSTNFVVQSRYPFYRNIDPLLTDKIRQLCLEITSNSRGLSGVHRIFYWDLRRMTQIRILTIKMRDVDLIKHGELIGSALGDLRRTCCQRLMVVKVEVSLQRPRHNNTQPGRHVKDLLGSCLDRAKADWPLGSWKSVDLDPLWQVSKKPLCVGRLAVKCTGCNCGRSGRLVSLARRNNLGVNP